MSKITPYVSGGAGAGIGVLVDQFLVDSKSSSETSGSVVLAAGQPYLVVAQGTWSNWNSALEVGTPNADAMFPSSTAGRVSTQVGVDPECWFAFHRLSPSDTLGHKTAWQFDLGSGAAYITPQGGPYSTPQPNYLYRYSVKGQGAVLKAIVQDSGPYTDNYGKVQVSVYSLSGSSSGGGGAGGAVPPAGGAPDGDVLLLSGGLPAWGVNPGKTRTLNVVIDGNGSVIPTGVAGDVFIDFACTITKVTMLADTSGSIVVDIWKAPYGSFPPTVANTITASDLPTISSALSSQDSTLTGWTKAINAGDDLRFNVNSVASIKRLVVALTLS